MLNNKQIKSLGRGIVNNKLDLEKFKELNNYNQNIKNKIIEKINKISSKKNISFEVIIKNLLEKEIKTNEDNKNNFLINNKGFLIDYIKYLIDIESLYKELKNKFSKINISDRFTDLFFSNLKVSKEHLRILEIIKSFAENNAIKKSIAYKNLFICIYQPVIEKIILKIFSEDKNIKDKILKQVFFLQENNELIYFFNKILNTNKEIPEITINSIDSSNSNKELGINRSQSHSDLSIKSNDNKKKRYLLNSVETNLKKSNSSCNLSMSNQSRDDCEKKLINNFFSRTHCYDELSTSSDNKFSTNRSKSHSDLSGKSNDHKEKRSLLNLNLLGFKLEKAASSCNLSMSNQSLGNTISSRSLENQSKDDYETILRDTKILFANTASYFKEDLRDSAMEDLKNSVTGVLGRYLMEIGIIDFSLENPQLVFSEYLNNKKEFLKNSFLLSEYDKLFSLPYYSQWGDIIHFFSTIDTVFSFGNKLKIENMSKVYSDLNPLGDRFKKLLISYYWICLIQKMKKLKEDMESIEDLKNFNLEFYRKEYSTFKDEFDYLVEYINKNSFNHELFEIDEIKNNFSEILEKHKDKGTIGENTIIYKIKNPINFMNDQIKYLNDSIKEGKIYIPNYNECSLKQIIEKFNEIFNNIKENKKCTELHNKLSLILKWSNDDSLFSSLEDCKGLPGFSDIKEKIPSYIGIVLMSIYIDIRKQSKKNNDFKDMIKFFENGSLEFYNKSLIFSKSNISKFEKIVRKIQNNTSKESKNSFFSFFCSCFPYKRKRYDLSQK